MEGSAGIYEQRKVGCNMQREGESWARSWGRAKVSARQPPATAGLGSGRRKQNKMYSRRKHFLIKIKKSSLELKLDPIFFPLDFGAIPASAVVAIQILRHDPMLKLSLLTLS